MQRRSIEVNKRTNAITMETEYQISIHQTDIGIKVKKTGCQIDGVLIQDAETLEDFAKALSKAWAQYLKIRPTVEVVTEIPEVYQHELPGIK